MITGTISSSDYLNAQRLHRAKTVRWFYLIAVIVILGGSGIFFFAHSTVGLIVAGASLGALLGELVMSALYLPWKSRRIHAQQKDFASPFTYTWDSSVIEARGVSGQSKREWVNYAKVKEDDWLFLLYHADNLFEMVPKRWFQNQAQIQEFRELASRAGKA